MMIGEYLKRVREEKKISLEQVAEGTMIRIKFLQAIEEDRLTDLPSLSQARGFCRLYATFLGLDPIRVFDEIEKANQPVVETETQPEISDLTPERIEVETRSSVVNKVVAKVKRQTRKDTSAETVPTQPLQKPLSQRVFEEIGRELQQQRESLGLSRADVERQIKIREYFIFSLENGQIDNLPSTVQGRGMLNNYAAFMSLDAESLQMRYAEGLQQRRQEQHQEEEEARKTGINVVGKDPLSGWRRFLTPDLLVGGSVFIILFSLVIWGAVQVIRTSFPDAPSTESSITQVMADLTTTPTATQGIETSSTIDQAGTQQPVSTVGSDIQATITSEGSGPIQVVIVAYQRAYMKVTVDGQDKFSGRVIPGNVYSYSGKTKIALVTGNGAALQVYYNQQDQGVIGLLGEVVELEFTTQSMLTPTPRFTATPTVTSRPTLTALPTETPQPTPTIPTATITPARTITPQQ